MNMVRLGKFLALCCMPVALAGIGTCENVQRPDAKASGMWLTPRKDPRNQARADIAGRMTVTPQEVWRYPTGGAVVFAREVTVQNSEAVLIQVSSNLEVRRWSGETVWRRNELGVSLVLHVGDFDGDGGQEALVRTDLRTAVLLDVATGRTLWTWQSPPNSFLHQPIFYHTPTGIRFICFPNYSLNGYCFDFSGDRENPTVLWEKSYAGKYGNGYGPGTVLKDMDADGKPDIVLHGKIPSVYQAVIDTDTGEIKFEVYYDVPGEGSVWGRPYGLLQAADLDGDGAPEVVMVCCQVEEYIAVARNVGGQKLEKIWSHFVEKDWPTDVKELRPQITSLAGLQGNGKIELLVGLWDNGMWQTLIVDPLQGFEAQRGRLEGYYFWGCYDLSGDGVSEVIVSTEAKRRPARTTTLVAFDGRTLQPVSTLHDAAIFTSTNSSLPPDRLFGATRSNPVFVTAADGTGGILVRKFEDGQEVGTFLWGAKVGGTIDIREVAQAGFTQVHLHDDTLLLSDGLGRIQRFGEQLTPVSDKLVTGGRVATVRVWDVDGRRELVIDISGGAVVGGTPDFSSNGELLGQWSVKGSRPVLHVDASGTGRLAVISQSDEGQPLVLLYTAPISQASEPVRIPVPQPIDWRGLVPYGDDEFRVLVCLRRGPHDTAFETYDARGNLVWVDKKRGAHSRWPAAADLDGDGQFEVISDDHGVLRIYDSAGSIIATVQGKLYTLPIVGPFGPGGETWVLRGPGMYGMAMMDRLGKDIWAYGPGNGWRYYRSYPAVGDVAGQGRLDVGALTDDGSFECIDTRSGALRWSVNVGIRPHSTSVVAGDVDGDGRDEFLFGSVDGNLICVGETDGVGKVEWRKEFDAAVSTPIIADVDGDGVAEIIVSTSDGDVRVLKEQGWQSG